MNAAKTGIIAKFQTGYLQRELPLIATVAGGVDKGLRDKTSVGYAPGRLVKIAGVGQGTEKNPLTITAPTGVTETSIGDATHIIAQSDDTIKEDPKYYSFMEQYSTLPNLICENSTTAKTVAVFKIIDKDDIQLINLG